MIIFKIRTKLTSLYKYHIVRLIKLQVEILTYKICIILNKIHNFDQLVKKNS